MNKPETPPPANVQNAVLRLAHAAGVVTILCAPVGQADFDPLTAKDATKWITDILTPLKDNPQTSWDDMRHAAHKLLDECCRRLKCANCGGVNDTADSFHCSKCDAELAAQIPF